MNLEEQVIKTVHEALTEAIKSKLGGYNTPLDRLINECIQRHSSGISALLDEAVSACLKGDFKEALQDACTRRLAKVLISKSEGEIEKQANELRSSPEFRAKLVVAISETVKSVVGK